MNKISRILLFTTVMLAPFSARAASLYSVTDLGTNLPYAINSYGQISGDAGNTISAPPFLWTPTTPNATTGEFVDLQPPSGTVGARAINDYGELVAVNKLWKPTVPNGSAGTWTTLSGIQVGTAINAVWSGGWLQHQLCILPHDVMVPDVAQWHERINCGPRRRAGAFAVIRWRHRLRY